MGLSASQGRLLLLTAKQSDLEFRAQQISQKRLVLAQQLEQIAKDYEDATSNRVMNISMYTTENGEKVQKSGNLTYKNLISGIFGNGLTASEAGIQAYSATESPAAASNKAYRLIDTSGAIVVSNYKEIPTTINEVQSTTTQPKEGSSNIYVSTDETSGTTASSYYVVATGALSSLLSGDIKNLSVEVGTYTYTDASGNQQTMGNVVSYTKDNTTEYYDKDGNKINTTDTTNYKDGNFTKTADATLVAGAANVPSSKSYTSVSVNDGSGRLKIQQGGDGKYSLVLDGVVKYRYVVDEGLAYGSTGSATADDPNYLQDCLRNGKYLLQQYNSDKDKGDAGWNQISWDATSNISDKYFTDDDAAAKAKYDRAQNEIQTADKKLELELDQVESQRNAVKTEIESVEKVMNDNIEKSFKPFQA